MSGWVAGVNQRRLGLRGQQRQTAQLSERDSPGKKQSCRAAELLSGMRQQPTRADGDGLVCRRERERWSRR